jgi:hypothetical protein
MTRSPFTLVYSARRRAADMPDVPDELQTATKAIDLGPMKEPFLQALQNSTLNLQYFAAPRTHDYISVLDDLRRSPRVVRVGLWDIGARVGRLPAIIAQLNAAQPTITFFHVHAAVRVGLLRPADQMIAWLRQHRKRVSNADREEILDNFIVSDFYPHAERVRRSLGLAYLIGIPAQMVAFEEDDDIHWNYFAHCDGRTLTASAYNLAHYARLAKRPYEAAVAGLAVSIFLACTNPRIDFHRETRGCVFDFNEDRASIVKSVKTPAICDQCEALLKPEYRRAGRALLEALRRYPSGPADGSRIGAARHAKGAASRASAERWSRSQETRP